MRYFIKLSYKGTCFHGWQRQNNAPSIQEEIERALSTILREDVSIVGCGRTDTGVHAHEYFAHFDFNKSIELKILVFKLNSFLVKDIAVQDIFPVNNRAHTRFDALQRSYRYFINYDKDPFNTDSSWYLYNTKLDVGKMNQAAQQLLNFKDFSAFEKIGSDNKTSICDVSFAKWLSDSNHIYFEIRADRFLRNMVRAIVGTLVEVGKGNMTEKEFIEVIKSGNRSKAGSSVPAQGLFLWSVHYSLDIRINE
ncbi:MAG: tRNA pseudouridine(38-40) synthase TruA [Salibacteraceae bacterium]